MTYTHNIFRKSLMMLPVFAAIGFMLTATLSSSITAEPQNVPENALLPDITPGVPKHLHIHNQQQSEFLRFTNVWANVGEGALEFEEGLVVGTQQQALQNLYDDEESFGIPPNTVWSEVAGDFIFHPTHNHWHIDDVGEFSVRIDDNGSPGTIAPGADSLKIGFCIVDVFRYDEEKSSPRSEKIYWDCETELQWIQPGWADQYHQSVEGNAVDISNLVDGTYFLVHKWNPLDLFVDADDSNNESWAKFTLEQSNGNGNRKITILEEFAPECQADGSTPGICGDINKNS